MKPNGPGRGASVRCALGTGEPYQMPAVAQRRMQTSPGVLDPETLGRRMADTEIENFPAFKAILAARLSAITGRGETGFVDNLVGAFAAWAGDLPASEKSHHRAPFGLLLHSVDTAWLVSHALHRALDTPIPIGMKGCNRRSPWILAAVAAALLHDCGKLLDRRVWSIETGELWDPRREPLTAFRVRLTGDPIGIVRCSFLRGRGLKGHEAMGPELLPLILPPSWPDDLVAHTLAVYDAYVHRHDLGRVPTRWPLPYLAGLIVASDRESSADDEIVMNLLRVREM